MQQVATMCSTRWTRLERYALWRQRRLRLHALPSDVIAVVCRFLPNASVHALLSALRCDGGGTMVRGVADVIGVPIEMRQEWLRRMACDHLATQLRVLASHACFFGNDACTHVHAFADWTAFRVRRGRDAVSRRPIAEYSFAGPRPEWTTRINECVLRDHVDSLCDRSVCATRITLHTVIVGPKFTFLLPGEMSATLCLVYPHFLIGHV